MHPILAVAIILTTCFSCVERDKIILDKNTSADTIIPQENEYSNDEISNESEDENSSQTTEDSKPIITNNLNTISEKYINDQGIKNDSDVIKFFDFETQASQAPWTEISGDISLVDNRISPLQGKYAHFKVDFPLTNGKVADDINLARKARLGLDFETPLDEIYVRFYTYFPEETSPPHHFIGVRGAIPGINLIRPGGAAGIRPDGNLRFASRMDIGKNGQLSPFFYTYTHKMKCHESNGMCYGNTFEYGPEDIKSFATNTWVCLEFMIKLNTPNLYDGEQAIWLNGEKIRHHYTGSEYGQWLHSDFFLPTHDKYDRYPRARGDFEGYNFRKNSDLKIRKFELEYYQSGWKLNQFGFESQATHHTYYDNLVIAKSRIGCMK